MSAMRAPVVAGVGGGVGTTTVAVGLRGHDSGRVSGHRPDGPLDILVCRGDARLGAAGRGRPRRGRTRAAGAGRHAGRAGAPRPAAGAPGAARSRTPPRWCCCRTSGGGARSRTRWPRRRNCSWNRPHSCPGRCAPTRRRCASWWPRWRPRAASLATRSGTARSPVLRRPAHSSHRFGRTARSSGTQPAAGGRRVPSRWRPDAQGAGPARPAAVSAVSAAPVPAAQHRAPVVAAPTTSRPPTLGTPPPGTGPPQRRRGVRIVAPDAVRPTGPQRPREDRAGTPAERVEQVG